MEETKILDQMICEDFRQRYLSAAEALQAVSNLKNQQNIRQNTIDNPKPSTTFAVPQQPQQAIAIQENTNVNVNNKYVVTTLSNNQSQHKFNQKLIITIVSLTLAIGIGGIILSRNLDIGSTDNETSPKQEKPAF